MINIIGEIAGNATVYKVELTKDNIRDIVDFMNTNCVFLNCITLTFGDHNKYKLDFPDGFIANYAEVGNILMLTIYNNRIIQIGVEEHSYT